MATGMLFWVYYTLVLLNSAYSQDSNSTTESTTTLPTTTTLTPEPEPSFQPTEVALNADLAECTCDLTANGCDVECCCDPDCSSSDIQVFSQCIDEYTPADSQTCLKSSVVLLSNVPYVVNETVPELFCVQVDNYEERNYYSVPNLVTDIDEFQTYVDEFNSFSFQQSETTDPLPTGFYMSGDPIYTVYESLVLGKLGLPRKLTNEDCIDSNPAAFLYDESSECVRPLTSLSTECQTNFALDAAAYFNNFKLLSSSKIFHSPEATMTTVDEVYTMTTEMLADYVYNTTITTTAEPGVTVASDEHEVPYLYNSSLLITIIPTNSHVCITKEGLNTTCSFDSDQIPSPTYELDAEDSLYYCNNVVTKVEYFIEQNGTAGISSASVRFTFTVIDDSSLPLTQTFATHFSKHGEDASGFESSGNPGYVIGQPLMAGNLVTTEVPEQGILQSIEIGSDRDNWLTMVTSSVMGDCISEPNNRVPVTFGEDMRSGCNIRVTLENMTNVCELIQQVAINALVGPSPPEYVATFGNTAPESVGDWVQIFIENLPPGATSSQTQAGVCVNVVLGMHIEVVYANVGALGNPQPKILGVAFRYEQPQDIRFQCIGPYCQPGTENTLVQTFQVTSSVGFTDASESAIGVKGETKIYTAKLPSDFFYPFS